MSTTAAHLVGQRLRAIREDAGLTLEEVGRRLGVTGGAIRHFECARRPLTFDYAERIAAVCGFVFVPRFEATDSDRHGLAAKVGRLSARDAAAVSALVDALLDPAAGRRGVTGG